MTYKPTVAVDLDGCLHSYTSGWTGPVPIDPPEPGALEFVQQLQADGYLLVVFTTRAAEQAGLTGTRNWLKQHGFPMMEVTAVKPMAVAYVDDRAVAYAPKSGAWGAVRQAVDALAGRR